MQKVRSILIAVSVLALSAGGSWAANEPGATGHWTGAIQTPEGALQAEVDLAVKAPGGFIGTISIPSQNIRAFPLSSIDVKGEAVSFAMKGIPGDPVFKGRLSADAGTLSGDFTLGAAQLSFSLKRSGEAVITAPPKSTPIGKEFEGAWEGSLNAGGLVLHLKLTLANRAEGGATGTIVSVDQGGAEIPITTVAQTGSRLELMLPTIGASYSAEVKEGRLTGDWRQGAGTLPLAFSRPKP